MKPQPPAGSPHSRVFFTAASITLLVVMFIGFRFFYLHLQAFPGRPLTPPIRTMLIAHGVLMTAWMLLSVVQPLLVLTGSKRAHMKLGLLGIALSVGIVVVGYLVAVNAARVNPPDLELFGLKPKEFLTVPLVSIALFALLVLAGVLNRRRPEVHRPMMLLASLAIVSAALGRMPSLSAWYAGTWLEHWCGAFVTTLALGILMLLIKCGLERRFDRWFATAFGAFSVLCVAASLLAKTNAWARVAEALTR